MINGIINVYKEKGYTSFDVVAKLRGILKTKKIGHTGTLDPDAEGVLPVCLGKATKVCDLLTYKNKEYEAVREQYENEAKERWGNTSAYKESAKKTADYSKDTWNSVLSGMNEVLSEFAECKKCGELAESGNVQKLVKKLQSYITANFYHCTDDILAGLGEMYVGDERFRENIDRNGEGTAAFISEAIRIYCHR